MNRAGIFRVRRGLAAALLAGLAAAAVRAGPYGGADSGVAWNDPAIAGWATEVLSVERPDSASGGFARDDARQAVPPAGAVLGEPAVFDLDATDAHVLSLGNGGSIVLAFRHPLRDGPGADFAVFENGFTDETAWEGTSREGSAASYVFAELAAVEVATTTNAWARLPSSYLGTEPLYSLSYLEANRFASQDPTQVDGLAGKTDLSHGVAFDLAALRRDPLVLSGAVDLRFINYIRLVDVVGNGSVRDSAGNPICDPYYNFQTGYPNPAPAASTDGFDLRGAAALNFSGLDIRALPGGVRLQFFARAGRTYRVFYAASPSAPPEAWTPLTDPLAGEERIVTLDDLSPAAAHRVYRYEQTGP